MMSDQQTPDTFVCNGCKKERPRSDGWFDSFDGTTYCEICHERRLEWGREFKDEGSQDDE